MLMVRFFEAAAPFALGSVYVNFLTQDESASVGAADGHNFERLAAIKARYDPGNVFFVTTKTSGRLPRSAIAL